MIHCLLCGETTRLSGEKIPGYMAPETFSIYYCPSCGTSFSYPRVDTNRIYELIYKNAEKVPDYYRYMKYKNAIKTCKSPLAYLSGSEEPYWVINSVLSQNTSPKESLNIIEVGSGLGYLTYALTQAGYRTVGLDISQKAVDEATKTFGKYYVCTDVFEYSVQHKESYDVIILTEVIEHVETPVEFLASLMHMLKKGGQIILTTPNKTIYPEHIVWQTDSPPVHLWWFSENSMRYIAGKINASVQFVDFTEYYKKQFRSVNIQKQYKERDLTFNSQGNIVVKPPISLGKIRHLAKQIPYAGQCYKRLMAKINHHYICSKRGLSQGVIFQKTNFGQDII
jgi:2-polyprenyl-3-methyl-5-hydroxy-6-metoxy-1,4-benzoquinol methylase